MSTQGDPNQPHSGRATLSAEHEVCCMALGKVIEDVRLTKIGPDAWSLFTLHGAGNSRIAPRLPNRLLVFRVADASAKASLVILNAIWPDEKNDQPFAAIRALSKELGAPVRFIINPGPEHHMSLPAYARAFPDARVCVAAGRIERENPDLCAIENVEAMAPGDALPELSRQGLHVHVWDGFMEQTFINKTQFRFGAKRGTAEPTVFWHEASGIFVNGGHGWFYWGEGDKQPWLIRRLFKPQQGDVVWSPIHYSVHDAKRCIASAQRILDWGFEHLVDLHVGADKHIEARAHAIAERLIHPLVNEDWESLPFGIEALGIPEGKVTGGNWKSYK